MDSTIQHRATAAKPSRACILLFFTGSITSACPTAIVIAADSSIAEPASPRAAPITAAGIISTASTRNIRPSTCKTSL